MGGGGLRFGQRIRGWGGVCVGRPAHGIAAWVSAAGERSERAARGRTERA